MAKKDPVFLVVVDDSEEMHQALQFACGRAKAVGGKVALMYCIAPAEFEYWAGVGELMRQEAREAAEEIGPDPRDPRGTPAAPPEDPGAVYTQSPRRRVPRFALKDPSRPA